MMLFLLSALLFGGAIAFGVWRRFTSVQWIWLLTGAALALLLAWFVLALFVIGPEMVRRGPPGQ